ncbi:NAD(P)-binding protein [Leucosporidium creatinivorum]|uniref:NAD(P)-binding protein n=1 Tax=Leucosporidium creatinivorum TaxID=106004 RepID=A0A1Y2FX39_9BASI|nr:NAD(P)-binding protein [Leucosporidium creatinivorum]
MLSSLLAYYWPDSDLSATIFPPANKFSTERDVPSLAGKVFLVTGGNAGIGFETVKQLLLHGGKVYLAARSEEKALAAIKSLRQATNCAEADLIFLKLDLGDLTTIKASARNFLKKEKTLDVLICNAGVMVPPLDSLTTQEYDLQFGTNVLGHYLFTKQLVPALLASYESAGIPSRIVNLSSSGHRYAPEGSGFVPESLKKGEARDKQLKEWGMMASGKLYGQSKLGNLFLSGIFARDHKGKIVTASIHPGGIRTELQRHATAGTGFLTWLTKAIFQLILFPSPMGAYNSLYAAVVAPPEEINGQYIIPWTRIGNASAQSKSVETQEEVRQWMEKELLEY